MTGTIKLTVIDDDAGSGKALTKLDGTALPLPTPYASVVGNCIGPGKVNGKPDKGSNIYFMPELPGAKCDLSNGTKLKIKLDVDLPGLEDAATFPEGSRVPILCIYDDPAAPNCTETYAKFDKLKGDHVAIYTLQNFDAKTKLPKYYKINFELPIAGRKAGVTLDPKVINRPKFGDDVALALLCVVVTGAATLVARQLLARTNLVANQINTLSIVIGLALGLVTAFALRGAIHF